VPRDELHCAAPARGRWRMGVTSTRYSVLTRTRSTTRTKPSSNLRCTSPLVRARLPERSGGGRLGIRVSRHRPDRSAAPLGALIHDRALQGDALLGHGRALAAGAQAAPSPETLTNRLARRSAPLQTVRQRGCRREGGKQAGECLWQRRLAEPLTCFARESTRQPNFCMPPSSQTLL
jgi:hypothetical protein